MVHIFKKKKERKERLGKASLLPDLQPPSFTPRKVITLEMSDDTSRDVLCIDEQLFYCSSSHILLIF